MTKTRRNVAVLLFAAVVLGASATVRHYWLSPRWPTLDDKEFWALVSNLSEPGGVFRAGDNFRSDNLVSNERALQQVIPDLLDTAPRGAYLGVGPEQNFTYIATLKPTIAFIIDIRRQNMLLHLMYKGLIEISTDRADFVSRQFARPRPPGLGAESTVHTIFDAFKNVAASEELGQATIQAIVRQLERVHGLPLSPTDEATIQDVYHAFVVAGPDIRWDPEGGAWIPSYTELMEETDRNGVQRSYLASEETFQVLKAYETTNRIVPLVGDFAGDKTLRAVADYLQRRDAIVAAFYTSNVETYLRGEKMSSFAGNVAALPIDQRSAFLETYFHAIRFDPRPEYETRTMASPISKWLSINTPAK